MRSIVLDNKNIMARIVTTGASLVALEVPGRDGELVDVALGFDDLTAYQRNEQNIGAIVGRVANRTAGARFTLNGISYQLAANEGENNNHSGPDSWTSREFGVVDEDASHVTLSLKSKAGDQGFPGSLDVLVTYELVARALEVRVSGRPSEPTLANIIHHGYYNLNGHAAGSAMRHLLQVNAESYTIPGPQLVPTGEIAPVAGTDNDFRSLRALGETGATYDTNFVLDAGCEYARAARLVGDETGIVMDVDTDRPGMQVYTSNFLDCDGGKGGAHYAPQGSVCLETQLFPDSIHHPTWPSPIITPERPFSMRTRMTFSLAQE